MASTFFGLNIATSAVYASQAGLSVTGHNISNENTKGYTRQVASQSAGDGLRFYASYGMLGSGVEVTGIEQIRDSYYDVKYRNNEAKLGEFTAKYDYTLQIEDYFNEIDTDGFTIEYENLFSTLKSMQGNPSELTYRMEFLNYCSSISEYFNDIQSKLIVLQQQCNTEVSNMVDRINNISRQIASLNKQINTVELTGSVANDLRDKRELLLDELAGIIPIEVKETKGACGNSDFEVKIQGVTLVETYESLELYTKERVLPNNKMDSAGLYDIYFQGTKLDVLAMGLSGKMRATMDIRDGNNGTPDDKMKNSYAINFKGIPYYIDKIQEFKETLAETFNNIHQNNARIDENGNEVPANYNLYGDTTEDIPIFIISDNGVMTVNEKLIKDPALMALSIYPIQDGVEDAGLAEKFLEIQDKPLFRHAVAEDYLQSIVSEISIDVMKSRTFEKNYTNIKASIKNQRLSVSGVDGDEEAMNLMKYQEAFELASKMISVMKEIYDKMKNEMGV